MKKLLSIVLVAMMISSLTSAFADVTITPPAPLAGGSGDKTMTIDFETLEGETAFPDDITVNSVIGNSLYTDPYAKTSGYVSATNLEDMFYVDTDGHRYLQINPTGSNKWTRYILDKDGHNDITGFDEVRLTMKWVKRTNVGDENIQGVKYDENTVSTYYDSYISFFDWTEGTTPATTTRSKEIKFYPTALDAIETHTFKREDFADSNLNMDGNLKPYTSSGKNHYIMLQLKGKAGVGMMIDKIEFVWKGAGQAGISYSDINFENGGANSNDGLKVGATTVKATVVNPGTEKDGVVFCAALYNKTTNQLEDVDTSVFKAGASSTPQATVTVPANADPANYTIKVLLWEGITGAKPVTAPLSFGSTGVIQ